ncbi:MAG: hypothetical protein ACLQEQ_07460 [Nitrososphaerales archaeon]
MAPGGKPRRRKTGGARRYYLVAGLLVLVVVGATAWYAFLRPHQGEGTTEGTSKPVILYVNQGNGVVNVTNFDAMADFAVAHGFNTIFFQIYREGVLLFSQQDLQIFVSRAHLLNLNIFFSLYITNSSQQIPSSIYASGENGVSLDMSALSLTSEQSLLASLKANYGGMTAVTTTDMSSPLKPDLLVLETYSTSLQSYIRPGVIGSVGVFATSSQADYQSQFQYALQNSDGVMVFDYAGLMKSGY